MKEVFTLKELRSPNRYWTDSEKRFYERFPITSYTLLWNAVYTINWGELCAKCGQKRKPYIKGANILRKLLKWSEDRIAHANDLRGIVKKQVYNVVHDKVDLKVGDDTWDDIINHIIGCGPDAVLAIIESPKTLGNVKGNSVESFAYCFNPKED
ncbi:MAG: hypothetical protein LUD72_00935 [Bacteroidales bacterium]|nr:hypothetical protein [Bacteroidales bacterium]